MRKDLNAKGFPNKKMNSDVYAERRVVIAMIYVAKSLLRSHGIEIARVDVRITERETGRTALGMASIGGKSIWIPCDQLKMPYLYQVVLHELCHALWGIGHNKRCKLMHPNLQSDLTPEIAEQLFVRYAKKHSKTCNILAQSFV